MQLRLQICQRQTQQLKQRQVIEQKQSLNQKISLTQYLKQEDFMKGLINYVNENNSWVNFKKNGFDFRYGLVPSSLAKPIMKDYGPAFTHCFYDGREALFNGKKIAIAKGQWVIFLVEDKIPPEFRDFVAIHERGEELSLGNHYFASQLEFGYARKMKKNKDYTNYIDETYPSKFVDLEERVLFPIIHEDLMEHLTSIGYSNQKKEELEEANKIIEDYPITADIVKKMNEYSRDTESFCKTIKSCIPKIQRDTWEILNTSIASEKKSQEIAKYINKEIGGTLKNFKVKNFSALSKPKIYEALTLLEEVGFQDFSKYLKSHIILETNPFKLIQKAKSGGSIVDIKYSVEEQVRINGKKNI